MSSQEGTTPVFTVSSFLDLCDPAHLNRHNNITSIAYNSIYPGKQHAQYDDSIWLEALVQALRKVGISCENTGHYDEAMADAISTYQSRYFRNKTNLGILDDETLNSILQLANSTSPDSIEDDDSPDSYSDITEETVTNDSPHYAPFFSEQNSKQFRQNHKNIKIKFGNSGIVKEIHDVVMRSVGVEVDTSGNPISETYEFIARDITETDEVKDVDNYEDDNGVSPSDIKYKFNFK